MMKPSYHFKSRVWQYQGTGGWHFASIPKKLAGEIKTQFAGISPGYGSIPVVVTIGDTTWETSVFFDKKMSTYLLPLKLDVRKREKIKADQTLKINLEIKI